ncbi:ABC transporter permease [Sinorhizobium fredii]|uniref:ABC transporter permease n=1 Tax=Rhizobium fredii TaxID=380 RepID=UPI0009B71958|nr:ABC transporter permease [Sinorhizobium fredii]WOS65199.1 ABC transporter permease [Sinorhizobium fredii GR64]
MSIDQAQVHGRLPAALDVFASPTIRACTRGAVILAIGAGIGCVLFFLLLPTLIVVPMSLSETDYIEFPPRGLTLKWYSAYFNDPDWMAATWFSLKIALATTATATVVGTMAALSIVRGCLPFRSALQALALGPMIVPHIILGVALYLAFAPLQLTGSFFGFLVAHTVLAVPYVIITVTASLQRFDPTLELAALNCGANRLQAFFLVVLPNIMPGVAAAAVFAFLASFDEATVAFFISDIGGKSIGRKMFEDIDFNLTSVIAAVSTVLVATSLLLMGAVRLLNARKPNA